MSAGPQLAPLPAEWQRAALDGDGRWSLGADTAPLVGREHQGTAELRSSRLGSVGAPEPDRALANEVADHDPIDVPFPDRHLIMPITSEAGVPARRSCSRMYCVSEGAPGSRLGCSQSRRQL